MSIDFFDAGFTRAQGSMLSGRASTPVGLEQMRTDVQLLQQQAGRLSLLNQALWELLQVKLNLQEADFLKLVEEVDLRDGKADGQLSEHPLRCPQCSRVNSSRHQRCLYCGQEFEGPIFGTTGR